MTLKEFLETAKNEINYYIGAEAGGGFFFIGEASKGLADIPDIQKKKYNDLRENIRRTTAQCKEMQENLAKNNHLLKRKKLNLKNLKAQLKTWVPLLDREVVSVDEKTTVPGLIVVVEGYCSGTAWFIEEYDSTQKPASPKITTIHPDGYENFRGAIIALAAEDYKETLKYKRKTGSEPGMSELKSYNLEAFFRSPMFEKLCEYEGETVIEMIRRQVILEEIEAAQKEFEQACE